MMEKIPLVTPGEILNEEFLKPLEISSYRLTEDTGMAATRISEILKGKRRITTGDERYSAAAITILPKLAGFPVGNSRRV